MNEDKVLTEKGFVQLVQGLKLVSQDDIKDFAKKEDLKDFATKDDLDKFETKEDLEQFAKKDDLARFGNDLESRLVKQIVESNKLIITTVEKLHGEVIERLDELELNTVKRGEFEAQKRKVDRHHPSN